MCPCRYRQGGSLLHCLSTLTSQKKAVSFCCTGLGVTSTGRYPASCPMKPGLSSSAAFRRLQPRSPVLLAITIQPFNESCKLRSRQLALRRLNNLRTLLYYTPAPSSTIRSSPSAAVVASISHLSFWACPS